jgi:hypothetical protein
MSAAHKPRNLPRQAVACILLTLIGAGCQLTYGLQNWQAPTTTDSDENLSTPDAGIVLYLRCSNSPFHILESVVRRGLLSRPTDNVLFVRDDFVGADVATLAAAQASILQQLHLSMMPTHCGLRGHAFVRMERIAQAVQVGDSPYNMLTPSHL